MLSSFFCNSEELAGTLILFSKFFNILEAAFANSEALSKIYINGNRQDIIYIVIKARLMAIKGPCKHFFKAIFSDVYKNDNHMTYYNFDQ